MNWMWINVPLMVLFFAVWTGVPLWLSLRHTDTGPVTPTAPSLADELALLASLQPEPELVGSF